jgi:DNA-binding response OmpR family regulator
MQAPDGTSGLALAQDEAFGLIVLDVMLPGLDGYEELVLRVAAILRRTNPTDETDTVRVGDLSLEPRGQEVRRRPNYAVACLALDA